MAINETTNLFELKNTTIEPSSKSTLMITIYVIIGFFGSLVVISLLFYCCISIKRAIDRANEGDLSSQKSKPARSTDIDLFKKSNENVSADNKLNTIRNEIFSDLESKPVLEKYKSDSLESIDTNGVNNKPKT